VTVNAMYATGESAAPLRHVEKMGAVARVAGGLSHDVGDLVEQATASIRQALGGMPAEDDARGQLEHATHSLNRAAMIARQLEALSRLAPARPAPRALGRTVNDLLPLATRLAGASIRVSAGPIDTAAWITADPGQIEQVVFHLVVNARDAMEAGGTLSIGVEHVQLDEPLLHRYGILAAGQWSVLQVRDTGRGMCEEVLTRLFEPFFTTKVAGLGSGLGLATVYGIARQLGGQVVVESVAGEGTSVALWVPAGEPESEAPAGFDGAAAVLVVDDDEWVRAVTARSLRRAGYGVLEAADANGALNILGDVAGRCVQVVLTDIAMPGMSGRALAATLADRWPSVRVVLMTGLPTSAHEHPRNPPLALLLKPFSRHELLAAIAG
jgi:two-component system cell cycle sensor histidine kinase/response regulator CckA